MGKILVLSCSHPEFLHDAPGREIVQNGERDDFPQLQVLEAKRDSGTRSFRGEPLALLFKSNAPSNLNSRRKRSFKGNPCQAREADKRTI